MKILRPGASTQPGAAILGIQFQTLNRNMWLKNELFLVKSINMFYFSYLFISTNYNNFSGFCWTWLSLAKAE